MEAQIRLLSMKESGGTPKIVVAGGTGPGRGSGPGKCMMMLHDFPWILRAMSDKTVPENSQISC